MDGNQQQEVLQAEATEEGHEHLVDRQTAVEMVPAEGIDERSSIDGKAREEEEEEEEESIREKLKRHRREMAGRVWIPEMWGKEKLLKDWSDCHAFDCMHFPQVLTTARESLVRECRRAHSAAVLLRSNPT